MPDLATLRQTVVRTARSRCRTSSYAAQARLEDAPLRFSPTSLVRWAYASIFRLLEDDLLILHRTGTLIVGDDRQPGDLIFRTGKTNFHHPDRQHLPVGHVGILIDAKHVVHASPWCGWVNEDPIDVFLNLEEGDNIKGKYRGVYRLIPACA